jgi:hypothetical protein
MTVKELIERLRLFPEHLEVIAYSSVDGESRQPIIYAERADGRALMDRTPGETVTDADMARVTVVV